MDLARFVVEHARPAGGDAARELVPARHGGEARWRVAHLARTGRDAHVIGGAVVFFAAGLAAALGAPLSGAAGQRALALGVVLAQRAARERRGRSGHAAALQRIEWVEP